MAVSRLLNDLRQGIPKWVIRLLAFEMKVIAAITAGFGISLVVVAPASLLTGLTLGLLELKQGPGWATLIIQIIAIAIWVLASLKLYWYLKRRVTPLPPAQIPDNTIS